MFYTTTTTTSSRRAAQKKTCLKILVLQAAMTSFFVFLCLCITICRSTLNRLIENNANSYNSLNEIDFAMEQEEMVNGKMLFGSFLSVMAFSDVYLAKAMPATVRATKELFDQKAINALLSKMSVSDEEKQQVLQLVDEQIFSPAQRSFEKQLTETYNRAKLDFAKQTAKTEEEKKKIQRDEELLRLNPMNLYSMYHKREPVPLSRREKIQSWMDENMAKAKEAFNRAIKALKDLDAMSDGKLDELLKEKSRKLQQILKPILDQDEDEIRRNLQPVVKWLLGTLNSGGQFIMHTIQSALVLKSVLKFPGFHEFRLKLRRWWKEWLPRRMDKVKEEEEKVKEEISEVKKKVKERRKKRDRYHDYHRKVASQDTPHDTLKTVVHAEQRLHKSADRIHTPYGGPKIKID